MRRILVVGVTSACYLEYICHANFIAKYLSSFVWVFWIVIARIMPVIWLHMSLYMVMMWCKVPVCVFDIHRVQYGNSLKTSMTYLMMFHLSCGVKSGRWLVNCGFCSHWRMNPGNQKAQSRNCNVEFNHVFTSLIRSTAIRTLALWQSLNSFQWPRVRVIYTASILCYINISFRSFKMSSNRYFLNYLC